MNDNRHEINTEKIIASEETKNPETEAGNTTKREADAFSSVVVQEEFLRGQAVGKKHTAEEERELQEQIEDYRHSRKLKRSVTITAILTILICLFVAYKLIVRPPELAQPSMKPGEQASSEPLSSAAPGISEQPGNTVEASAEPTAPVVRKERLDNVYNILLVGREQSFGNTDTIMLCRFDAENGEVKILSIPRDTCANVESNTALSETKKINSVFARDKIEGLMDAVSDMIGSPVDNYIMVGINAFVRLVDTVGGVSFDVPYYMNYDDPTQNLHIHFNTGYQYLTGSDAIKVVRWRQNNDGSSYGDLVRIQTQQNFLKTILKQCLSINNIASNLKNYVKIFEENVTTDMTNGNLLWFAQQFLKIGTDHLSFFTLPTQANDNIGGFAYGTILLDDWLTLLNESFNAYTVPLTQEDINVIYRDASGNLTATNGEIAGGMSSFLDYQEYLKRLEEWNRQQHKDDPQPTATPQPTAPPEPEPPEEGAESTAAPRPTAVQPPVTTQPTESGQPPEGGQPTEGEQPTESGQPTEGERPTEGGQPTEGEQPTESGQPTEGEQPTESGQPTEGEQPTESGQPEVTEEPMPTAFVSPANLIFTPNPF